MANLNGQNIGTNYKGFLNLDSTINTPLDATLRAVTDGMGNSSVLQLSTAAVTMGSGTITSNGLLTIKGGGANILSLRDSSNVEQFSVSNIGTTRFGTYLELRGNGANFNVYQGGGGVGMSFYNNNMGTLLLTLNDNSAGGCTIFTTKFNLGGTTSSFPAIKRNGAAIDFRLADDSDYCDVNGKHALFTNADGNTTLTVKNTGNGSYNAILDLTERTNGNLYFGGQGLIVKGLMSTFGGTATNLGATVGIKGSGTTSATTSLLVQNSAGTAAFNINDERSVGINSRNQVCFSTDAIISNSGLRILAFASTGKTYLDGWSEGTTKATNYPLVIGSRITNTTGAIAGSTTAENGTPVVFGSDVYDASALVQMNSTTRGFLPPVMTTVQKVAIATPAKGLLVIDSTLNQLSYYNGTTWVNL